MDNSSEAADRDEEDAKDVELENYLYRIGAKSLAAELSDLRFRNRIIEAQRWLEAHEGRISYEEKLHNEIDKRLMSNDAVLFDKAQTYMNFVVTLGYAGFFAIWNFVRGFMEPWDMKLVAVMLGLSLLVFILWTLIAMVVSARAVTRVGAAIRGTLVDREQLLEAVQNAESKNLEIGLRLQRFWLPTFSVAVFLGVGAGLILFSLLLADILGYPFSIHGFFVSGG